MKYPDDESYLRCHIPFAESSHKVLRQYRVYKVQLVKNGLSTLCSQISANAHTYMYVTITIREKDAVNMKVGYMGEARAKKGREK